MVNTDNSYLKKIDETVKGESVEGVHNNNFYLKEISENITGGGGSGVTVDSELSDSSTNPVRNSTITNALTDKLDSNELQEVEVVIQYYDNTSERIKLAKWSDE